MVGYKKGLSGLLALFTIGEKTDSFAFHSTFMSKRSFPSLSPSNVESSFRTTSLRGASPSALLMTPSNTNNKTPINTNDKTFRMTAHSFISPSVISASAITASAITASALAGSTVGTSIIAGTGLTIFNSWSGKKLAAWTKPLFSAGLKRRVQKMSNEDLSRILDNIIEHATDVEIDILIENRKLPGWSKGDVGKLIRKATTIFLPSWLKAYIIEKIILDMDEANAAQLVNKLPVDLAKHISKKLHVQQAFLYILTNQVVRVLTQCVFNANLVLLESAFYRGSLDTCMNIIMN